MTQKTTTNRQFDKQNNYICRCNVKRTVIVTLSEPTSLHANIAMPDSQLYPLNLLLIEFELDLNYCFEN